MKRLPVLVATVLVVLVASIAAAVGVVVSNRDDDGRPRMGPGMMHAGSWSSMMGGSMMGGWSGVASEPDFMVEMIAHHRDAVDAARELARSDRPQMRSLGTSIVASQSAQIKQMTAWLDRWYPDVSTSGDYRPMMRDLSGLAGDRLDRVFLQDMVGHHMVAVMMSQHLLWRGTDHDEVAELARTIRDDQHAEIIQMQRWLAQWFDVDWYPGMMGGAGRGGQGSPWMGHGMMWRSGS